MEGVQEASSNLNSPPPFLSKTYDMVDDASTNSVVSWSDGSNSFVVWNVPEFARDLLPKYFKHNNFSSFVRQLNTYGLRKVDPDRWEFANEGFLRDKKHLLRSISRRKPAHVQNSHQPPQPQVQSTSVGACVEVGKFGLEEEVERLKRDKNVLMQELVRLRQQQQTTDSQIQTVGQRVQVMEQCEQQIMSFLAKAMQSPGIFAQFVQPQNESNRRVAGNSKKRRLARQEEEISSSEHATNSSDGRIVKYQPSMNEAAKAMVLQIMKINASPRLEPSVTNSDAYNVLDRTSSSTSGVTFSEDTPTSGLSFSSCPSAAISEIQSSPPMVNDHTKVTQYPEMDVLNSQDDTILLDYTEMQGIVPESTMDVADVNFVGSETRSGGYVDPMSAVLPGRMGVETDAFPLDHDMDNLLDGIPKLPGMNDVFWEQFLATSPLTGDTDEISSSTPEEPKEDEFQLMQENGWNYKSPNLDNLTAQMGLLTSEGKRG